MSPVSIFAFKLYIRHPNKAHSIFGMIPNTNKQNRIRRIKMRILTVDNLSHNLDKLSETVSEDMAFPRFRQ